MCVCTSKLFIACVFDVLTNICMNYLTSIEVMDPTNTMNGYFGGQSSFSGNIPRLFLGLIKG